jgi:four helix bundle protein
MAWQLADAGTSIAANYEEAKGSYSRREIRCENAIVLKEAREARLWLRVILACHLASEPSQAALYEANELVGIFITARRLRAPQTFARLIVASCLFSSF